MVVVYSYRNILLPPVLRKTTIPIISEKWLAAENLIALILLFFIFFGTARNRRRKGVVLRAA